jgi:hypothetical protein
MQLLRVAARGGTSILRPPPSLSIRPHVHHRISIPTITCRIVSQRTRRAVPPSAVLCNESVGRHRGWVSAPPRLACGNWLHPHSGSMEACPIEASLSHDLGAPS